MDNFTVVSGFDTEKPNVQYGKLTKIEYYSNTTQNTRKCYVLLPAGYSPKSKYPVLYLLHGIGGTESEWLNANPREVIGNLIYEKEAQDMIVVIPNIRASKDDSVPKNILSTENINAFDNFINDLHNDLMPYINSNYPIKEGRENTAIAGLSMGGRESLYIGIKDLDKFAYIGAFSPAPGLLPDTSLDYPGQFSKSELTIPKDSTNKPKVLMICTGNQDSVVLESPKLYHNTLLENGVNHIWYTIDGDHDFSVWKHGLYNFVKRIFK